MEDHHCILSSYVNNLTSFLSAKSAKRLCLVILYLQIVPPALVKVYSLDSKELVVVSMWRKFSCPSLFLIKFGEGGEGSSRMERPGILKNHKEDYSIWVCVVQASLAPKRYHLKQERGSIVSCCSGKEPGLVHRTGSSDPLSPNPSPPSPPPNTIVSPFDEFCFIVRHDKHIIEIPSLKRLWIVDILTSNRWSRKIESQSSTPCRRKCRCNKYSPCHLDNNLGIRDL